MKKKLFVLLGCVSIIVCAYGLFRYRVASWLLFLLFGLFLIFYDKIKSLLWSSPSPEEKKEDPQPTPTKSFSAFPVVGVTFSNEDGTERQRLLKKIYFRDKPFDSELFVSLERYLWEEKAAYYVKVNGYIVGNVEAGVVWFFEKNCERPLEMWIETHYGRNGMYSAEVSGRFLDVIE